MRGLRSWVVGVVAATLVGLGLLGAAPAQAASAPSIALRVSGGTAPDGSTVELTGTVSRVRPGQTVRAEVRTPGTPWRGLGSLAPERDGSFRLTTRPVTGPNRYRVVLLRGSVLVAASPVRTVTGLLAADPPVASPCCPVSVSGQLPTRLARPVELRGTTEQGDLPVLRSRSDPDGHVRVQVTVDTDTTFVLHAPAVVVHGRRLPPFTSPPLALRVEDPPAEPGSVTQVGTNGGTQPRVSGDGGLVAYTALVTPDTPGTSATSVFVWDRRTGERRDIATAPGGAPADGTSDTPSVSADGRFVAFFSTATDLVPGDDNGGRDLFLADLSTGAVERLTTSPLGVGYLYSAALSADARFVAYTSSAADISEGDEDGVPDAFLLDRSTGRTTLVSHAAQDPGTAVGGTVAAVSATGRLVTFVSASDAVADGDEHAGNDVFQWDAESGTSRLVSRPADGAQLGSVVAASADGCSVAYQELTGMLVGQSYRWSCATDERTVVADPGSDGSDRQLSTVAALSADGRYGLVEWQTTKGRHDVFRVDFSDGTALRLNGTEFEGVDQTTAYAGNLSDDARFASFWSIPVGGPAGLRAQSFLFDAGR